MSKKSFADVRNSKANGRRRDSELVCFHPTLAEEYQQLATKLITESRRSQAADPEAKSFRRAADVDNATKIAAEMEALIDANPTSFYDVVIEAMVPAEWNSLRAEHPPRDGNQNDGGLYNADTFRRPALAASLVDPEGDDETVDYFLKTLTNGEIERLVRAIWNLNEGGRSIPKPGLISSILAGSAIE